MVTGLDTPVFWICSLSWFWRCKEHPSPINPDLGVWRKLKVPNWRLGSWSWFGYGHWSLIHQGSEFWLYLDFEGAKDIHVLYLSPDLGLWWGLEVPDMGLACGSWFWYGYWSLIHPYSEFRLSIFTVKMQRISMSLNFWFGPLKHAGGSWVGFGILILNRIWSLIFGTPMLQILAHYLYFAGAKNIHVF